MLIVIGLRIYRDSHVSAARDGEEIPDSVTAELEKLEQEGSSIAEAEAIQGILGDLVEEDDDGLLGELYLENGLVGKGVPPALPLLFAFRIGIFTSIENST